MRCLEKTGARGAHLVHGEDVCFITSIGKQGAKGIAGTHLENLCCLLCIVMTTCDMRKRELRDIQELT